MIIVGLGNPGKEYEGTRHNVGFLIVNRLAHELGCEPWKKEKDVAVTKFGSHYLVEPWAYMNASGAALREWLAFRHLLTIADNDLLIVHDDLDFPLGDIKSQVNRSAGGHNGVQSIIDALGKQTFERLRIGIGNNRELGIPAEDYVLQQFTSAEAPMIATAVQTAAQILQQRLA